MEWIIVALVLAVLIVHNWLKAGAVVAAARRSVADATVDQAEPTAERCGLRTLESYEQSGAREG